MQATVEREPENAAREECRVNVLDLLLVISRHIRIVLGFSLAILLITIVFYKKMPITYVSSSKLMVLEYVDHFSVLGTGEDGAVVMERRRGHWKPADVFGMKEILNSSKLQDGVGKKLHLPEEVQYKLTVTVDESTLNEKSARVITVKVTGSDREAVEKVVTASVEEAGRLGFQLDLLSSPTPVIDHMPDSSDHAAMVMYMLEAPGQGKELRPSVVKRVLLPTVMATFFSLLLVLLVDFFQNLNYEDRRRVAMIKTALLGRRGAGTSSRK